MYLQELLEVAIGLVFIYILLSLVCMQVQEWLAGLLRWRADNLEDALREMLNDDAIGGNLLRLVKKIPWLREILKAFERSPSLRGIVGPASMPGWVDALYAHPLIRSLAQPGTRPSYIPARQFALVLFDIVMTAGTEASIIQHALSALKAQIQSIPRISREERIDFENSVNAVIAQAAKLVELSRPGLIDSSELKTLRADAWNELKQQLEFIGLNTDQIRTNPLNASTPRKDTLLGILLDRNPELKRDLQQPFNQMARAIVEVQKISKPELHSPLSGPRDPVSADAKERQLRRGITALHILKPDLGRAMESILLSAKTFTSEKEQILLTARTSVENWFDATMDRTSGWYKRNAQLTLFVVGLLVASLLNIDSLGIATKLWKEPTIRQALVAQAEKIEPPKPGSDPNVDPAQAIRTLSTQLSQDLNLPVGWSDATIPANPEGWFVKGMGLLLSAIAASFGAPFWFDVLDKVMNIRGAGKKPAKAEGQPALQETAEAK